MESNVYAQFLEGKDEQKYIVAVESSYRENHVYLIIHDPEKGKYIEKHRFRPFLWLKEFDSSKFYKGNRDEMRRKMIEYGIKIKTLNYADNDGYEIERLKNGYKFLVQTNQSYSKLLDFFKMGGMDSNDERYKEFFLKLGTTEQFLIQTGKRLFKGFEDYNEIHRLTFDIETTGLNPDSSSIFEIGIKDNRGFEHVLKIEDESQEIEAIKVMFQIINELQPAIICGYNSEVFDWTFIIRRCELLGYDIQDIAITLKHSVPLYRKKATLKLGAEMEYYDQTVMWGYNIMDIYHAVRRAQAINSDIKEAGLKYITKFEKVAKPNRVYIPHENIKKLWNTEDTYIFNESNGSYSVKTNDDQLTEDVIEVSGKELVTRYLLDDLWETDQIDFIYNQATFLLSKIVPSTLQRTSTMGTAALWKTLMLGWSYENDIAVPYNLKKRKFTGGLARLLKMGYSKNIVKFDYKALYPSEQLTHNIFPDVDITGALKGFLKYIFDSRDFYKKKMKEAKENKDDKLAQLYDRKQLPLKILNNTNFGSISAPDIYPWGDCDVGEMITCTGRQYLRLMITFFMEKGYEPIVGDTDGFNFLIPDDIDSHTYVSKGLHKSYPEGKSFTGVPADLAEFNELYMRGVMELSIDYFCTSTINIGRKNYVTLIDDEIKIVGNTLKSKKLPKYIEEFIDTGVTLLLNGNGKGFINLYYDYIEKIFNKEIPLIKIASRSKVKQSIKEYLIRCSKKNVKGNAMSKQAHMELLIKNNIIPALGDVVYYINTGTKKSQGDVQNKKNKDGTTELIFNSILLSEEEMLDVTKNKDINYNIIKYVDAFNKRIAPLLVCFSSDIREEILISDPEKRMYFTDKQMELVSGIPIDPEDQDDLERDVMTMEQSETDFWTKMEIDPNFMIKKRELV
jgi:DNA polymerase elongation subunit (family B)